jgi:hypothetical protein
LSRLEPFAKPRIMPCSLVSKLTVWLVSEKSQHRKQIAVSERIVIGYCFVEATRSGSQGYAAAAFCKSLSVSDSSFFNSSSSEL